MFFKTLKKKIKECFVQGEHAKRRELLEAIAKIISDEYTEDNFYSRFTWLVEELLISDPAFNGLYDKKTTSKYLKKGLAQAVDEATKRLTKPSVKMSNEIITCTGCSKEVEECGYCEVDGSPYGDCCWGEHIENCDACKEQSEC